MTIGIDIDDTIVNTGDVFLKYSDIFNDEIGFDSKNKNYNFGLDVRKIYGWTSDIEKLFYRKYFIDIISSCTLKEDASLVINRLFKDNKIIIITSRRNFDSVDVEKITKDMLDKFNICYDKIIFGCDHKFNDCINNNVDIFIDDTYEMCKEVRDKGINVVLFNSSINSNISESDMVRADNWLEIEDIISNIN